MSTNLPKAEMLKTLCEKLGLASLAELARLVELTPQAVYLWSSRNSFDAELIAQKIPTVSGDWLLTNTGSVLKGEEDKTSDPTVDELLQRIASLEALLAEEQRMHAKSQEQCDRLLDIMKGIVASEK